MSKDGLDEKQLSKVTRDAAELVDIDDLDASSANFVEQLFEVWGAPVLDAHTFIAQKVSGTVVHGFGRLATAGDLVINACWILIFRRVSRVDGDLVGSELVSIDFLTVPTLSFRVW